MRFEIKFRFIFIVFLSFILFVSGIILVALPTKGIGCLGIVLLILGALSLLFELSLVTFMYFSSKVLDRMSQPKEGLESKELTNDEFVELIKKGYTYTKKGELISESKNSTF